MQPQADVIVVAAGASRRMGGGPSKVLRNLAGRPLLAHTLSSIEQSELVSRIALVCRDEDRDEIAALIDQYGFEKTRGNLCPGGNCRAGSVFSGLSFLHKSGLAEWVMIHDAARPFITGKLIAESLRVARETGASVVAMRARDTIKQADEAGRLTVTLERSRLWQMQTPQTFRFDAIWKAYNSLPKESWEKWTDDAMVAEATGVFARPVECDATNIKITSPEDFALAEFLLEQLDR